MERLTIRKTHGVEPVKVLLQGLEIGIVFVLLHSGDNGGWADETRDVIDVTIRVVTLDAVAEPEDFFSAEFVPELFLNRSAVERGVAVWIEQATLGGQESAMAVGIDGSALEDEMLEVEQRQTQGFCNGRRHGVVLVEGREFVAPGVESEIQHGKLRRLVAFHKNRPVVAAPWFIRRNVEILDAVRRTGAEELANGFLLLGAADIDADDLGFRQRLHHFDEGGNDPIIGFRKAIAIRLGPGNPSRLVRFPLGRHAISFF